MTAEAPFKECPCCGRRYPSAADWVAGTSLLGERSTEAEDGGTATLQMRLCPCKTTHSVAYRDDPVLSRAGRS